jgi:hypothetical protein
MTLYKLVSVFGMHRVPPASLLVAVLEGTKRVQSMHGLAGTVVPEATLAGC